MEDLPEIVPLFPLPNVVLFPEVDLPLHVFEPRYREMVADAMASDRLIAMVLLRGDWRKDYHASPPIFPIGCAGRIERFSLLPDGRSNMILRGLRCFDIVEELPGKTYRRARVRWRPEVPTSESAGADGAKRLRAAVTRLLSRGEQPVAQDLWERLPSQLDQLVNQLGFALEIGVIEKLSLLECRDALERAERLIEIVEFRLAEQGLGAGRRGDEPWH